MSVDNPLGGTHFLPMNYTQLFRSLREAKGMSLDMLAAAAGKHRNTVANVESGRPVKFVTVAELMKKMGHDSGSAEMKALALLWLESVSGIPFSRSDVETTARKSIALYRSNAKLAVRQLEEIALARELTADQICVLYRIADDPDLLSIIRDFMVYVAKEAIPANRPHLRAAEDKSAATA